MADLFLNNNNLPESNSNVNTEPPVDAATLAARSAIDEQREFSQYRVRNYGPSPIVPLTMDTEALNWVKGMPTRIDVYNQDSAQYLAGLYQPMSSRVGNFFGSLAVNIVGETANLANIFTTPIKSQASTEYFAEAIQNFKEYSIDSLFPTYTTESYATQDQSIWQKFGDAEFWNKEANETIAFLVGSAITSGGTAMLKLGSRLPRFFASVSKASRMPSGLAKGATAMAKLSKKYGTQIDNVAALTTQTYYEASAEANGLTLELKEYYEPLIRSGAISAEKAKERIDAAASASFKSNAALLIIPNMISTNLINKGMNIFKKTNNAVDSGVNKYAKTIFDKNLQLVTDPITRSTGKTFLNLGKGTALGIVSEGTQEVIQESISNSFGDLAKFSNVGELDLAEQFAYVAEDLASSIGSNEFEQAFVLGAVLGGIGGGVAETGSYLRDVKNAEKLRTNLQGQYKAGAEVFDQVAKKDGDGNYVFKEDGSIELDKDKIKEYAKNVSMKVMDNIAIQDAIEQGDYAKAERIFLSRVIAPLVYNHVNFEQGKELFMANIHRVLSENKTINAEDTIPTYYGKGLEGYYDLVAEEYQYMEDEGMDIISENINNLDLDLGFFKKAVKYYKGETISDPLNKEERKEFNKKKAEFRENARYAFTILGARRKQNEKIVADLQEKINIRQQVLDNDQATAEEKERAEKQLKDYKKKEAAARKELKYLNSEYAKMSDPDWFKYTFKRFLKESEAIYYTDNIKKESERNKQEFIDRVKDKNYNFKTDDKKSDYQNLDDQVVFQKKGEWYVANINNAGKFVVTKFNKDFKYDPTATTLVDWLMVEDETFFEDAEIQDKEVAKNFMRNIKIRNKHIALVEAAQLEFNKAEDLLNRKEEQLAEIEESIKTVSKELGKLSAAHKKAMRNKDQESVDELRNQITPTAETLANLKDQYDTLVEERNTLLRLQEQYQGILSEIESYMATANTIEYDTLGQNPNNGPDLDKRTIIESYFARPEVQEIFGELDNAPLSYEEYNDYITLNKKVEAQKKQIARIQSKATIAINNAKGELIALAAESLASSVTNYVDVHNEARPENTITFEDFVKDFPVELKNVLEEYKNAESTSAFKSQVIQNIYADPNAYENLLVNENIVRLQGELELKILRSARKLNYQTKTEAAQELLDRIKKSFASNFEVAEFYRRGYEKVRNDFETSLSNAQDELNKILDGTNSELLQFTDDFASALRNVRTTAYSFYKGLSASELTFPKMNIKAPFSVEQNETIQENEEAYRLKKGTPFTTINGIVQFDSATGTFKLDENGMPILRDNQDAINANAYINSISADDVANGDYVIRYVDADQLEELFKTPGKKAMYDGARRDAMYAVVYYKGEPALELNEVVYVGIGMPGTYFKGKDRTTIDKEAIVRSIFKPKGKNDYNIYIYEGVEYDLNTEEGLAAASAIAVPLMEEQYTSWREQITEKLEAKEEVYGAISRISGGVPVAEQKKDPNTGKVQKVYKKIKNAISKPVSIIVNKTNTYNKGNVTQAVRKGLPYVINEQGQLVRVYREAIGKDLAYKEAIVKLLGFLGHTVNLKERVKIGNTSFNILSVGDSTGLINTMMNWGKSGYEPGVSKHLDIWLTGKTIKDRSIQYNLNGTVYTVPLSDLVTVTNNGYPVINNNNPQVKRFLEFLDLKTKNVDIRALEDKRFSKFFQVPNNLNYKTKKVSTAKEKYKSYQDYIIQTSNVSLTPDTGTVPQFLNRYFEVSTDINATFSSPSKVKTAYRKPQNTQPADVNDTENNDTTKDPEPPVVNESPISGDTVIDFQKFPKGFIKMNISDFTSEGAEIKNTSMIVNYDFTDRNNPKISLSPTSRFASKFQIIVNKENQISDEKRQEIVNEINKILLEDVINNNWIDSNGYNLVPFSIEDEGKIISNVGLHNYLIASSYGFTSDFFTQPINYQHVPTDVPPVDADGAATANDTDSDPSINCDATGKPASKKGGKKSSGGNSEIKQDL